MDTSEALVLETLTRACSQNSAVLKPAEQQLEEWQAKPGFYTVLCTIFSNHSLDVNVRWLAVLYFKNGVDRYWRKSAPNAIDEGEKEDLRKRLISNFNEPVPQVATQLAVLISKIARLDCPREWPALVPTLLTGVRCQQDLLQQRALLVLHHVTKTLASKRLTSDRKLFEDLTLDVFGYVLDLWNKHLSEFLQLASQHDETMIQPLDRTILTLRVLRKQAVFGFREPQKNPLINNFMAMVFEKVKPTLECRRSLWGNHQMIERVEKLALLMTKVLLDMLEHHPSTYVVYIRPTLDFVVTYTFTNVGQGILFERFTVNCFNLMKGIVHCDSYRPPKNTEEARDPVTVAAYRVITEFFTQGVLAEICGHLVSSYFLLTTDDLITWESDPEDYALDEGGDSYKFSLRPCTEVLFLSLFKEFRKTLIPVLLEIVNGLQGPCDPDNMADMLRKDAVYNAVGLASFDLYDDVDFDNWFSTHLLQELSIKHPNQRIIRRRVIWLAGQWVGVKFGVSLRPALYEAILPLLHTSEDLVVRIEAATTLKTAVDDFEFKTEQFLPYLDTAFGLLFQLLKDVDECDSKMHILHVISFVIERVGVQIRPHASCLVQYLPILWQDAAEHNMLRCAILTTLIHLVQGLGTTCTDMFHFLLPVIQMSTDMSQDPHIYLKEDGLELWHVTLHNTPVITDQLLNLVRNMPSLLELGSENLRISLRIIEAYLLLAPKELMQNYGSVLVTGLCGLMTEVRTEGLVLILRIVELVLRTFPVEGPQVFRPILPSVIRGILEKEEHGSVIAMYFSLLARIILQNTEFLWTYLNQTAPEFGNDSLELFGCLLDVWFEKMDSITQPERRKLSALALSSMLTLNIGVVLERFSGVLCLCVEVLHDVLRSDSDSTQNTDCLVLSNAEEFLSEEETDTEHDKRKRQLSLQDPVHTVDLREYVRTQLSGCCQLLGQAHFSQLMDAADAEIVHQLQELMKS